MPDMIGPMSKPVLAVGLLATMAGVWYWGLLPATRLDVPRRPAAAVAVPRPLAAVPEVHLSNLAAESGFRPRPAQGRNPFTNGVATSRAGGTDIASRAAAASMTVPGPPMPTWPRLDLIGVAEARTGGVLVRTAIVSGPHGVYHARAGELLEEVYRVERVDLDAVDVRLVPEDRLLRLALRP